jgi:hypothetical protein
MNSTQYLANAVDPAIMESRRETYKGWVIEVSISGSSRYDDTTACPYAPRIVVTEQLSIGFRELDVATERCFATPALCLQGGVALARDFIDSRA